MILRKSTKVSEPIIIDAEGVEAVPDDLALAPIATSNEQTEAKQTSGESASTRRTRKKHYSLKFAPLTHMIEQISDNIDEIVRYIEVYLNAPSRPHTKENVNLARLVTHIHNLEEVKRLNLRWEELVERYSLSPETITAAIGGGLYLENISLASLKAAKNAPIVMEAIVDRALTPKGHQDSRLLMEMVDLADNQAAKVTIGSIVGRQDNSTTNTLVAVGDSAIPQFMGEMFAKEAPLREGYRKALVAAHTEEVK